MSRAVAAEAPFGNSAVVSVDLMGFPVVRARVGAADSVYGVQALSEGGQFVVFHSDEPNFVAGDRNGSSGYRDDEYYLIRGYDVFVRDRARCTTERVSVSSAGEEGRGESRSGIITPDGRYVMFTSNAPNLAPGVDTCYRYETFLRDRTTGTTERVAATIPSAEGELHCRGTGMSANARTLLLECARPPCEEGGLYPAIQARTTRETRLLKVTPSGELADGGVDWTRISADGTTVAFASSALNLPPEGSSMVRIFTHDIVSETTVLIGRTEGGVPIEAERWVDVSGDGCVVVFPASEREAGGVRVYDCRNGFAEPIAFGGDADDTPYPTVSADGRRIAFLAPGEPFNGGGAFVPHRVPQRVAMVYDRDTQVFHAVGQRAWHPVISPDGSVVLRDRPVVAYGNSGTVPTACEPASTPCRELAALVARTAPAECAEVDVPPRVLAQLDRAQERAQKAGERASGAGRGRRALRRLQTAVKQVRRRVTRWTAGTAEENECQEALTRELDSCLSGIDDARETLSRR
jgi:hypothetical protein